MKKLWCGVVLLAVVTVVGLHASAQKETTAAAGPVKLVFLSNFGNLDSEGYSSSDNPYVDYIEEKFDVELEIIGVTGDGNAYNQKMFAIMASGDLPDYLYIAANRDVLNQFAEQGLIVPLDEHIAKYPEYRKNYKEVCWELASYAGRIYAIPAQRYDSTPMVGFVRADFVRNLGTDLARVKTINEWYELLRAFTVDDPDRNGKADTFGMTGGSMYFFQDAFDARKHQYANGQVKPYWILDSYKGWLKFMNKLYSEKLIDPEFATNTTTGWQEKSVSGKYGMFIHFWHLVEQTRMGAKYEDFIPVKAPLKENGQPSQYVYGSPLRHFIAITKSCKHPLKVVEMLNLMNTPEGAVFADEGVEGFDFNVVSGKRVAIQPVKPGRQTWRLMTLGMLLPTFNEESLMAGPRAGGVGNLKLSYEAGGYDDIAMLAPIFKELQALGVYASRLPTEFQTKAIMGQVDIDAQWPGYVSSWMKAGGEQWIALHTKWYESEMKK